MTEKLHLIEPYLKEWEAKVTEVSEGKFVVLDRTVFYSQSGGQPSDTGTMECNGKEYRVVFAKAFGENVSHEVDSPGLKVGDKVHCKIDWDRRYKLMRMHTSAHIISAVLFRKLNVLITGNQLDIEKSRMDFNLKDFDRKVFEEVEKEANEPVRQNFPVTFEFISREEAMKRPELFRLAKVLPKEMETLRELKIGDFDIQADGGTHVKNTSEIGTIKIVKLENKGRENRRLYWELD